MVAADREKCNIIGHMLQIRIKTMDIGMVTSASTNWVLWHLVHEVYTVKVAGPLHLALLEHVL